MRTLIFVALLIPSVAHAQRFIVAPTIDVRGWSEQQLATLGYQKFVTPDVGEVYVKPGDPEKAGYIWRFSPTMGRMAWIRPTQMGCATGQCGSTAMSGGCADGSCAMPSGMRQSGTRQSNWNAAPRPPLTPTQTPPSYPPPTQPVIDLEKLAELVAAKMPKPKDGIDGKDGQPGAPGIAGPAGPVGPPGPAGPAVSIDVDAIAAAVMRRLPPIHVQNYDRNGKLVDEESYPFGTPIKLQYGVQPNEVR